MKYTGSNTSIMSPIINICATQSRCLSGLASSGQLGTRSTVVSHVFDFEPLGTWSGPAGCSSTRPPSSCRRNGFQCEVAIRCIVVVGAAICTQCSRKKLIAIECEWFAACERIAFGCHHLRRSHSQSHFMLRILHAGQALAGARQM